MNHFFNSNVLLLRSKLKLTQEKTATALGLKRNTYANYESGHTQPDILTLVKIASFFGIPTDDLVLTDLSNDNLIEKIKSSKKTRIDNLNDNPYDNLNAEYEQKESVKMVTKEPSETYNFGLPKVVISNPSGRENIVHVPIKARAGYLNGYGDSEYIDSLPNYSLPGLRNGTFRSFEVEGHSMKPTMLNRDYVVGEWCESVDHIREGRVHIIVTISQGIVIKRVLNRIKERNKLYLKSDNIAHRGDYPTIELEPEEIKEIWYARMRFTPDFSEPGEVYNRLNDMEIAIMDLQKHLKTGQ